jgi:hypothetical protein
VLQVLVCLIGAAPIAAPAHAPRPPPPSASPASDEAGTPDRPLGDVQEWSSAPGYHETGVVAVALDPASRCMDLVVAAGNDVAPEPLMVFGNRRRMRNQGAVNAGTRMPDWISSDIGYHTYLAVGRVDDDDNDDIVAVSFLSHPTFDTGDFPKHLGGNFEIYSGIDCAQRAVQSTIACRNAQNENGATWHSFTTTPTSRVGGDGGEIFALSVALGDVNGDARLDIAIPILGDQPKPFSLSDFAKKWPTSGRSRVYLNGGGASPIDRTRVWSTAEDMNAASATFADVNQDGLLDLVIGAERVYVYFGAESADHKIALERSAGFVGDVPMAMTQESALMVMGVDAGWFATADGKQQIAITAGYGCPRILYDKKQCGGGVALYFPSRSTVPQQPAWTSQFRGAVSQVKVIDVGEKNSDILFDTWAEGDGPPPSGRLRIFAANATQPLSFDEGYYRSATRFVGEGIAVGDFIGRGIHRDVEKFVHRGESGQKNRVFTVAAGNMQSIVSVSRDGKQLPHAAYAFVPGGSWVALASPLAAGESIEVAYDASALIDVAVGTWETEAGIYYFKHHGEPDGVESRCDVATAPQARGRPH